MVSHLSPPDPEKPPRYPWDEWFDGREWTVMQGRDYWGETAKMQKRILGAAAQKRLRVVVYSTRVDPFVTFKMLRALPPKGVA
jgi:hypothetical protein